MLAKVPSVYSREMMMFVLFDLVAMVTLMLQLWWLVDVVDLA